MIDLITEISPIVASISINWKMLFAQIPVYLGIATLYIGVFYAIPIINAILDGLESFSWKTFIKISVIIHLVVAIVAAIVFWLCWAYDFRNSPENNTPEASRIIRVEQ